jgi:hypothetical protein
MKKVQLLLVVVLLSVRGQDSNHFKILVKCCATGLKQVSEKDDANLFYDYVHLFVVRIELSKTKSYNP